MANRLWMFNPGCATDPCCDEEEPNPTPCCTQNWTCSRYDMGNLTCTSPYGTINFRYVPTVSNGVTFHLWWGCLSVPAPRTTRTVYNFNNGQVTCTEIGQGNLPVQFNLQCTGSGQFGLSNQFRIHDCFDQGAGINRTYPDVNAVCNSSDGRIGGGLPFTQEATYGAVVVSETETEFTFSFAPTVDNGVNVYQVTPGTFVLTKPPLNPNIMRKTLYLNDGFGEVPMIYNGPRPVSLGTASDMWWGCATRAVTNGREKAQSGDCAPTPVNFDTEVVFGLWCKGPSEGWRLYMFHDGCGSYDDGLNVQTHQRKSLGCTTPWVGQYNQIVGGSINGIAAKDCSPFVFGPISQNFASTPYPYHPLREIYGDQGTWIITE